MMTTTYHPDVAQGSDEWMALRCGRLCASEIKHIITPTLKVADNEKTIMHLWELLAQRVTRYVEPTYIGDDMLRGQIDEIEARRLYHIERVKVQSAGFVTNDEWGFTIGYSPDGLVGEDGLIECKSRRQKFQVQTFAEGIIPAEYMLQLQTGLLVTSRKWIDFISYSGGLPMFVQRVVPIIEMQDAIIVAATAFEAKLVDKMDAYLTATKGLPLTERIVEREMI